MSVEMRFARPVFVEQKFSRFVRRLMQIVIDAAGFFARRRDQAQQRFFNSISLPGLASNVATTVTFFALIILI
jgi:hypothetical protein